MFTAIAVAMLGVLASCGGPASCAWFDEPCRAAARFYEARNFTEASFAEDIECRDEWDERPVRCIAFGTTFDSQVGTAIFADGRMETFDWMPAAP